MLGHVVAQKRGGRRKKRASMVPDTPKEKDHNSNTRKTRKAVQDVSNHKITEYFPVRRSSRKTGKQIEEEERYVLQEAIFTGSNEEHLFVYCDPVKGRGIKAGRSFQKNEFVVEYKGDMMEYSIAKNREIEYSQDPNIGSYMYFFTYKDKRWCIDATKESKHKGRLINHSYLRPNLRTKVVDFHGSHHLILVAKREIKVNEELLYDYGDRSPETIAKNPWLMTT
ncbi:unnamed protein product [Auanema sp. JU1783]|nr:unnamed protein product [Auanema sp. JU1783]